MKKQILYTAGLILSLLSMAQQELSLSDAIRVGLERNFDIQIENGNVDVAQNNNVWGEAGLWPTITLDISSNNGLTDNVKTAFPTATQGQTVANSLNPSVVANWTIFDGLSVRMSKRRLDQLQAETEGNASIVMANTLQAIVLSYYLTLLEQSRLDEFEKQLTLSGDRYDYIKVKSDIGGASSSEVLLEEGNYLTDSLNYINQQLVYRNAIRNLNVVLAETDPDKQYTLTDLMEVPNEVYSLEALQSKMLAENVDLKKQFITQSILGTDKELSKSGLYPTLSLSAGFNENRNSLDLSNATFFNGSGFSNGPDNRLKSVTDNYFANVTLSFTLFNGGKIKRAIRNAMVSENVAELRTDKLKQSLTGDLSEAFDRYTIRQQLYGINAQRERGAQTNLDISSDKFRNGSISSFDYRTVQNNYLSAAILKLQATYDLISSRVELLRLTGGLVTEYN